MMITNVGVKTLKELARTNPQLAFSTLMNESKADLGLCNFNRYHIINKGNAELDLEVSLNQLMKDDIKHNNCFSPDDDTKYNSRLCSNNSRYLYFTGLLKRLYMIKHNHTKYYVEPFIQYTNNRVVILPLTTHYVMNSINKYTMMNTIQADF